VGGRWLDLPNVTYYKHDGNFIIKHISKEIMTTSEVTHNDLVDSTVHVVELNENTEPTALTEKDFQYVNELVF